MEPDNCIASLRDEFASHFAGVTSWLRISSCLPPPLTFPWTTHICPMQMELVELQCNDDLKAKFYNSSPLSFFRDIAFPSRTFPKCIAHVQHTVAMFGVTYCCTDFPKGSARSLAFAPCSRTVISMTLFCCRAHQSSQILKYCVMASSTIRLTVLQ